MSDAYERLTNLLEIFLRGGDKWDEWERDRILLFLFGRLDAPPTVSDLYRTDRFGSLPTLQKRIEGLVRRRLVRTTVGKDKRTRIISMTARGLRHLEARDERVRVLLEHGR